MRVLLLIDQGDFMPVLMKQELLFCRVLQAVFAASDVLVPRTCTCTDLQTTEAYKDGTITVVLCISQSVRVYEAAATSYGGFPFQPDKAPRRLLPMSCCLTADAYDMHVSINCL